MVKESCKRTSKIIQSYCTKMLCNYYAVISLYLYNYYSKMQCKRCWKTNPADIHTCVPPRAIEIARIMNILTDYRSNNQDLRFWQMLFNIWYLKFPVGNEWSWVVVDPYNYRDSDLLDILKQHE